MTSTSHGGGSPINMPDGSGGEEHSPRRPNSSSSTFTGSSSSASHSFNTKKSNNNTTNATSGSSSSGDYFTSSSTPPQTVIKRFCGCCCKYQIKVHGPYLYAFDFDHTIVDQSSDTAVMAIIDDPVPSSLTRFFDGSNWEKYMEGVFKFVKDEGGTFDVIAANLKQLQPTDGMSHLLHKIMVARSIHPASKLIVVSDANSFFIETFFSGMKPPVVPDAIFTNKAEKTKEGVLKLTPYEHQTTCTLCPTNLCKGDVLSSYMESAGSFEKVYYVGDGGNDVCPALRLRPEDILFVRKSYTLDKILKQGVWKGQKLEVKAKIVLWETARDIEREVNF